MRREEGIGPALVIGLASSESGPLLLLAQDGAQPPSYKAVDGTEHTRCRVLEISIPAAQRRIDITDDPSQAVTPRTDRPASHLAPERLQALLADKPPPRLEPVAEEVKPLPRLSAVTDPRLVRMQRQAILRHPRLNLAQGGFGLRLRAAQDHEVSRPAESHRQALAEPDV